jgi:hypothetical protein
LGYIARSCQKKKKSGKKKRKEKQITAIYNKLSCFPAGM